MTSSGVYQCDICLKKDSVRFLPLASHEKLLALKLIRSTKKYVLLLREPSHACVPCFKKLYVFKLFIRNILLRKLNGKMQQPSPPLSQHNVEEPNQEEKAKEKATHDYTCQCESCCSKYGSLPLLLHVIEQKSLSEKTENRRELEPQPSTSSSQDPEPKPLKKVLACQYCKKTFTHKGDYNKHLRTHTKEQPFTCQVCKRKFAHTSNLQRHFRLHSGHRPFVCRNCDKSFSRKDKLDSHRRSKLCRNSSLSKD